MDRYKMEVSGGCQCGAVRYHATEMFDNSHICHCRMCQKAVGNIFAALVAAPREAITWTRGEPSRFRSSDHVDRGFCSQCGTPLFYD
ncbi:MAG: GFA family protein, partial [Acetobacteraceae bacterium]